MDSRSEISKPLGATKLPETDYTSQLTAIESQMGVGPSTPQNKQRGANPTDILPSDFFSTVPDEVLVQIVTRLDSTTDLCALALVAKRWQSLVEVLRKP
jgi:F-box-like